MLAVQGEEEGDGFGFGGCCGEAVGGEDGVVVVLVGLAEFRGHRQWVVEVGQGGFRVERPCVKDGPGGLLDPLNHLPGRIVRAVSVRFAFSCLCRGAVQGAALGVAVIRGSRGSGVLGGDYGGGTEG